MSRRFDQTKNYYATLGLANTADQKTIRTTYHQVALSVHPDKTGNHETTEDISELNEAYRVLSDETLRKRYTERRARQDRRRLYGTIDQIKPSLPPSVHAHHLSPDTFSPQRVASVEPQVESRSNASTRFPTAASSAPSNTAFIASLADSAPVPASTQPPAFASRSPSAPHTESRLASPSCPVSPAESSLAPSLPGPLIAPTTLVPVSSLTASDTSTPASPEFPPTTLAPPTPRSAPPPATPTLDSPVTLLPSALASQQPIPPPILKPTPNSLKPYRVSDPGPTSGSLAGPKKASSATVKTMQQSRDAKTKYDERVQKRRVTMQAKSRDQRLLILAQTRELASLQPTTARGSHKKGWNKRAKKHQRKRCGSESSWDGD